MKKLLLLALMVLGSFEVVGAKKTFLLCQHSKNPFIWKKQISAQEDLYIVDFNNELLPQFLESNEGQYKGVWMYQRVSGEVLPLIGDWAEINLNSIKVAITFPWQNRWVGFNGMSVATISRKNLTLSVDKYPIDGLINKMQYKQGIVGSCSSIAEDLFYKKIDRHQSLLTKENQI
jgi:hypothetical protein